MRKLLITDDVLDKLGFSEYWDENGDSGGRTLSFNDANKTMFRILETGQMDDDHYGQYPGGRYTSQEFQFCDWFAIPKITDMQPSYYELYFLHQMYECIKEQYPYCLEEFIELCDKANMKPYIDEYLDSLL